MLPVVIYNVDNESYPLLLSALSANAESRQVPIHISLKTDQIRDVVNAVNKNDAISLFIAGVDDMSVDKEHYSLKLGRMVMQRNRDNYMVYITQNRKNVEDILCLCMRPAGITSVPLDEKRLNAIFRQIVEDFKQLTEGSADAETATVVVKVGSSFHRFNKNDILYLQALDKKIELCTESQSVQVYGNMSEFMELLGDDFVRCHRSYMINRHHIKQVNTREMTVVLKDGSNIPLSRSYKEELVAWVNRKEAAK